jgi:6-phosphogluconolactonase
MIYQFNPTTGTLTFGDGQAGAVPPTGGNITATYRTADAQSGAVPPGGGPRHLSFHPNGQWVYVLSEMGGSVSFFLWDSQRGAMTIQQTISALPPDYKGNNTSADIAIHPNGKFLYATDRGPDCLAVFTIAPDGHLTFVQTIPTAGKTPRNFTIDPTGNWIIVSNQDGNNVVVFKIDLLTGRLTQTGQPLNLPKPMCARFLPGG